jgi:hypothetical protein
MMLKPGRTWVAVVRGFGDVEISAEKADMESTAAVLTLTPAPTDDPNAMTAD